MPIEEMRKHRVYKPEVVRQFVQTATSKLFPGMAIDLFIAMLTGRAPSTFQYRGTNDKARLVLKQLWDFFQNAEEWTRRNTTSDMKQWFDREAYPRYLEGLNAAARAADKARAEAEAKDETEGQED